MHLPNRSLRATLAALMAALSACPAWAAPLENVPQTLLQPDGTELACFASGDEFYHRLHDAAGFTIVPDPESGAWVYACEAGGELLPTGLLPGRDDPAGAGLGPGLRVAPEAYAELRRAWPGGSPASPELILPAPRQGLLNNLVIFVRFSDEAEFTDAAAYYESMLNGSGDGENSMRNYYLDASYGALEILSHSFPVPPGATVVSYQDAYPRNYYKKKTETNPDGYSTTNQRSSREWALLKAASEAVASQVPEDLVIDADGDGKVDSVCFVVSGRPEGWSDLLWPHMWTLQGENAQIRGKRVWTYSFQLQTSLKSSGNGVLCHEMFHVLGSPDLYHYSYDGLVPVGSWDIMENTQNPPQHMGAYMKYRYGGWIAEIPEISAPGTYELNPLTSPEGQCYRIPSPTSTANEFFVVEFRKRAPPFEGRIPGSGLLVYRINGDFEGMGNRNGPPDEVYAYRPNGSPTANGNIGQAHFTLDACRTALTDTTATPDYLTDGSLGGLVLSHVGPASGDTITFELGNPQTCVITCSANPSPTVGPVPLTVAFDASDNSCDCSGEFPDYRWDFGDGTSSEEDFPTHTYAAEGTYTYTLTATIAGMATCTNQGTITVTPPCVLGCDATASPTAGEAPLVVHFSTEVTAEYCGEPTFSWDFGDGETSAQQDPVHAYGAVGTYAWSVTVAAGGQSCTRTGTVEVHAGCSLSCQASASPSAGPPPLSVAFTASSEGTHCSGSPSFLWQFGDGATSTEASAAHAYGAEGTYPWTLTVSQDGETCVRTGSVVVGTVQIPGDCDGDGTVSIGEVQKAINMFLSLLAPACGVDCNGDGSVSIGEVQKVVNNFLGSPSTC